jgi:gamma-glutamyl hercynylcysteine S-oxide hydrolase
MCRHLAYLGPPVSIASVVLDPPHSLLHQTWAPTDMRGGGSINADGFGIGWHTNGRIVRYRRACPMWSDASLRTLAAGTESGAIVAAARSATAGMPVNEQACSPFTDGRWLFSHNGRIEGWPHRIADLASALPVTDLLTVDAPTDSALLWVLVRRRIESGESPAEAVAGTVHAVERAAPGSRLNLLLADGESVVATTHFHALSTWQDGDRVLVSSEPLDPADDRWSAVPDGHLVTATRTALEVRPTPDVRRN